MVFKKVLQISSQYHRNMVCRNSKLTKRAHSCYFAQLVLGSQGFSNAFPSSTATSLLSLEENVKVLQEPRLLELIFSCYSFSENFKSIKGGKKLEMGVSETQICHIRDLSVYLGDMLRTILILCFDLKC